MKRLSLLALLLAASVAHAAKVPFAAQLDSFSDTAAKAYVKLTFLNKFQCIPIAGGAGLARAEDKLFPVTGSTSVTKMIVPNSDYTCGGVGNSTSYMVEIFQISEIANKPDTRLFGGETIIGPAGFDIATAQWVPPNPPPTSVLDYAIRNGNNTFTPGTTQVFTGVTTVGLTASSSTRKFLPAGAIDGVNTVFTFGAIPADHTQFLLYRNGLLLEDVSDYTISGNTVTMITVPKSGDKIAAYF